MNIGQLLTSSTDNREDNEFSYSRVHHLLTSMARPPESVNNGAINSYSFTNSKFEGPFCPSYSNMTMEIRNLQKALNFSVDTLRNTSTLTSDIWSNEGRTCQVFTDSGYLSKADGQGTEDPTQSASSSSNKINGAQGPATLGLENFYDSNINPKTNQFDSRRNDLNSTTLYEKSLKTSLDESETKRILLLEKFREAHLTI